jgi:hypothetical protein
MFSTRGPRIIPIGRKRCENPRCHRGPALVRLLPGGREQSLELQSGSRGTRHWPWETSLRRHLEHVRDGFVVFSGTLPSWTVEEVVSVGATLSNPSRHWLPRETCALKLFRRSSVQRPRACVPGCELGRPVSRAVRSAVSVHQRWYLPWLGHGVFRQTSRPFLLYTPVMPPFTGKWCPAVHSTRTGRIAASHAQAVEAPL